MKILKKNEAYGQTIMISFLRSGVSVFPDTRSLSGSILRENGSAGQRGGKNERKDTGMEKAVRFLSVPVLLALLINEVRQNWFKKMVQTVTYVPHFISMMVIAGIIMDFTARDGAINDLLALLGFERRTMLLVPGLFRPVYIISEIWQKIGWGSIVYLGALTAVDPQLYEAASIIMLILRLGSIMNVGYEKIILLYNPTVYETSDVISSYSYRKGLQEMNYSYSTAVGLFNSVINFLLVIGANTISRKVGETSLW